MQFPESWLFSMIDPQITSEELSDKLTMSGLEVEELYPFIEPLQYKMLVIEVLDLIYYDDSSGVSIYLINDGINCIDSNSWAYCIGIKNIKPGSKAIVANKGTVPINFDYKKLNLFGKGICFGEICLFEDLTLLDSLKEEIECNSRLGDDIYSKFNLGENIFNIKLTPNRADCLSILGVAREVAALTNNSISFPKYDYISPAIKDILRPNIIANDLCGRYSGRVIRNLNVNVETPLWIRDRLIKSGLNCVSVLVDISNYVMLELGIPSHIYDLDKISGTLQIRWSKKGEQVTLLNGNLVKLGDHIGVVSDNEGILGLAGIMGSKVSSVTEETKNIYIESAFWKPVAVAGLSRKLKLNSEAAYRYERGVDYNSTKECLNYITSLIINICSGSAGPIEDIIVDLPETNAICMRLSRCIKVLGVKIEHEDVRAIFNKLKMKFEEKSDSFYVIPPSYRFDLKIEEDLIEEVARLYGYENIPSIPPVTQSNMLMFPESILDKHDIRKMMASRDYQEVINYSFIHSEWEEKYCSNIDSIKLENPISANLSIMRSSIISSLVKNVSYNINRQFSRVRLFEIARVFFKDSSIDNDNENVAGVNQPVLLSAIAYGNLLEDQWSEKSRLVDFYDVKGDIEALFGNRYSDLVFESKYHKALHPSRSACISIYGREIGWIGELNPMLVLDAELPYAPIVFELELDALLVVKIPEAQFLSKQPMVVRDISLWIDKNIQFQIVKEKINNFIKLDERLFIVKDFKLFDVWSNEKVNDIVEEKSIAMRFWFQDDVTLDDDRVNVCINAIIECLVKSIGARHRI
ncbi:phenylalanine--tRNA ligase subunit beta [Candidatus Kinetoplastidibacterium crithidiae]|uniref:Phenylalanine--tRNA ligase beta subunit n=1 Tax=Candidatus Kinetoplastidibacterium crithidiae TCC036E TaxID=1208918 RepID=M1L4D6_9PROT|nr:phenylalanine--tRNA ligase subunit beta [Candidatus Kinetoplastibacterium crithidii]AFZ82766.1 phenylalanyl-tRNA synthetase subunit beta [Candidatus Kinetoplastibacterium crithidii (ex Angomonas deanei ATCC 30255)]AGF47583.1 phenylalanyl-tRNA synthetase beta chain [Candidatus Kinetoplastibacterium crithidii TCC036E]